MTTLDCGCVIQPNRVWVYCPHDNCVKRSDGAIHLSSLTQETIRRFACENCLEDDAWDPEQETCRLLGDLHDTPGPFLKTRSFTCGLWAVVEGWLKNKNHPEWPKTFAAIKKKLDEDRACLRNKEKEGQR